MNDIRLIVDATPLLLRSAGVKTYIYYWIRHLIHARGKNRHVALFPFLGNSDEPFFERVEHEKSVAGKIATYARLAAVHAANIAGPVALDWLRPRGGVFHVSNQLYALPRKCRITSTVYDLTCWLQPETHSPANVRASKRIAERVFKPADALIAISECTKSDAVRILGLPPQKIKVIYPGVAAEFFGVPEKARAAIRFAYNLSKPYVLFVGTIEPRKNVAALLDAWELLRPELRNSFDLILIGAPGWGHPGVLNRLRSGAAGARYLGYVAEEDLPALTAAASAFVYPSLYEGFGLPVAQAMAAGVPVVTSNLSSLPEIAGDAALLIDPRSPNQICQAMERLLESAELRRKLGDNGRERARQFDWEKCALQSWKLFERLCR